MWTTTARLLGEVKKKKKNQLKKAKKRERGNTTFSSGHGAVKIPGTAPLRSTEIQK